MELYIKNNSLRIIGEKGGKSSLVISLNNIPKDTYLKDNKINFSLNGRKLNFHINFSNLNKYVKE